MVLAFGGTYWDHRPGVSKPQGSRMQDKPAPLKAPNDNQSDCYLPFRRTLSRDPVRTRGQCQEMPIRARHPEMGRARIARCAPVIDGCRGGLQREDRCSGWGYGFAIR